MALIAESGRSQIKPSNPPCKRTTAMDSIIEVQRQTHEEIERFERALYTLLSQPLPTHESQLRNAHSAAQVLSRIDARVAGLNNLYLNEEARQAEFDILGGVRSDGGALAQGNDDGLGEFYKRLNRIQEHYAKYPDSAMSTGFEMELEALLEEVNEAGEEYDDYYGEEDRACLPFMFCVARSVC
jgi:splicing factor 3A subunit 3